MKYIARMNVRISARKLQSLLDGSGIKTARKVIRLTTSSKDISGGDAPSHQCHVQVTDRGGVHTCRHVGSKFEDDKWWCSLHAPSNVAKKAERKKAKAEAKKAEVAAKRAEKAAQDDGEDQVDKAVAAVVAVKLPDTVEEAARSILVMASEVQQALARMSNMTSQGWPENTPVENYKVMLKTINDEARQCSDSIMLRISKAKQILDPVGYPQA